MPNNTTRSPAQKKLGIFFALIGALCLISIAVILLIAPDEFFNSEPSTEIQDTSSGESSLQNNSDSSAILSDSIKVSAYQLWKDYSDNKVNADNLYKDKLLVVSGTVSDVTQDIVTKNPCINLETGDSYGLYPVQCFFNDDPDGVIASLRDGDFVTIIGTCSGVPVLQVQLVDCTI